MFDNNAGTRWYAEEGPELAAMAGVENEAQLREWFGGMSLDEIKAEADRCWPGEDNNNFARRIYDEVN